MAARSWNWSMLERRQFLRATRLGFLKFAPWDEIERRKVGPLWCAKSWHIFTPLANRQLLSKCAVQRREQGGHQTKILCESGFLSHWHHFLHPNRCCVWGSVSYCSHRFIPLPFAMSLENTQWLPQELNSAFLAAFKRLKSIKKWE